MGIMGVSDMVVIIYQSKDRLFSVKTKNNLHIKGRPMVINCVRKLLVVWFNYKCAIVIKVSFRWNGLKGTLIETLTCGVV